MRVTAIVLSFSAVVAPQVLPPPPPPPPAMQMPPRDVTRAPEPIGAGVIRGRVVAADTGNPIRRAMVNLSPVMTASPAGGRSGGSGTSGGTVGGVVGGVPAEATIQVLSSGRGTAQGPMMQMARPRQATTDTQGVFEFTALPAGSYRLVAQASQSSPQYLGIAYGAKAPLGPYQSDTGQPIQLSDGQTFGKAIISLPRGAVIAGRVTDENGDPLARVQVYTLMYLPGSSRGQRFGSGAQTDDLGQYRIFGLQPGEYVVAAEARNDTYVQPNAVPLREEDAIGYMTTYYPGTADEGAAVRVRARASTESSGIEIRLVEGRLFRLSGFVTDSQGRPLVRTSGQLMRTVGAGSTFGAGFSTDEQGQFRMKNVPPGNYRIVVRQMRPFVGPVGPNMQPEMGEMANMPLVVSADLDNLAIVTSPGVTITGNVVFEQGTPSPMPREIRVMATVGSQEDMMGVPSPQPAVVTPDLTFTMKGLMGSYLLRASAANQYVKSITANGEDVTDTPHEFKTNERVTVTLTSRVSMLEGTVTDAGGEPAANTGIILFSEDKASWRGNSTRMRRTTVDATGHYRFPGLIAGRYYVAAVPRDRLNISMMNIETAYFEQLAKEATLVVVGEDEQRRVDLKVIGEE